MPNFTFQVPNSVTQLNLQPDLTGAPNAPALMQQPVVNLSTVTNLVENVIDYSKYCFHNNGIGSLNYAYKYPFLDINCDVRTATTYKNIIDVGTLGSAKFAEILLTFPIKNETKYNLAKVFNTVWNTDSFDNIVTLCVAQEPDGSLPSVYNFSNIYYGELASYKEFEIQNLISLPKFNYNVLSKNGGYDLRYFRTYPRPQLLFTNRYYSFVDYYDGAQPFRNNAVFIVNEGAPYLTDSISKLRPFYSTYEEFSESIRHLSANRTILPEYKISEHIEYFELEKNRNYFSSPEEAYLYLYGTSVDYKNISKGYNSSDKFNKFILNNRTKSDVYNSKKRLKIKADAVLKLLPQKGFYPQERAVGIVDLFRKSYYNISTDVLDTGAVPTHPANASSSLTNSCPVDQHYSSLIQPFFAPGILFNSLKANVGLSWHAYLGTEINYLFDTNSSFENGIYKYKYVNATGSQADILGNPVIKNLNKKIKFEDIFNIQAAFSETEKDNNLYYLNPTYYGLLDGASTGITYPFYNLRYGYNSYNKLFTENNKLYSKGINNFIAEIPEFFLQDGQFSRFQSGVESDFGYAETDKEYYMDVYLSKQDDFKSYLDPIPDSYKEKNIVKLNVGEASLYGPPAEIIPSSLYGQNNETSSIKRSNALLQTELAYSPYAPPYLYGITKARLKFKAKRNGKPSISEIFNDLQITYLSEGFNEKLTEFIGIAVDDLDPSVPLIAPAIQNKLNIGDCVYFDRYENVSATTAKDNTNTNEFASTDNNVWVIQTKFESPSINFNTADNITALNNFRNSVSCSADYAIEVGGQTLPGKNLTVAAATLGLWSGYGTPTKSGEGIIVGIGESYSDAQKQTNGYKSLLELCKFRSETRDIGLISDTKEVSEAIVLIPYVENDIIGDDYADTIRPISGEKTSEGSINPRYFKIEESQINSLLGVDFNKANIIEILNTLKTKNVDILKSNSILNLIKKMQDYILPPHLDWLRNRSIQPFGMYIIDFKHALSKNDLSNIWQGVMPKISIDAEVKIEEFEHDLDEKNIFNGKKIPENTRFKVFKIKRRANTSYEQVVGKKIKKVKYIKEIQTRIIDPVLSNLENFGDYSYNWPYDYFSLIELAGISTEITSEELNTALVDDSNNFQAR